jgi:ABC-type transport system involved in multi-copper enzyme maturation permease subunit
MPVLTIALLTLREAVRRRLLLAVAVLTVLLVGITGWGFMKLSTLTDHGQPVPRAEMYFTVAAFVILLSYMFSVILAIGAAFLAAPAIAADVESGIVLAVLPRPIRRSDVVLGKWLGLAALLVAYAAATGVLETATVQLTTGYMPPHPALAVAALAAESLILLTLALLLSTRLAPITGGIIAVVLFGVAWIAGIAEQIGTAFANQAIVTAGTVMSLLLPTDTLWRFAVYNLEPAILQAASGNWTRGNPFGISAAPPLPNYIWALGWVVVMLSLAVLSFNRRDL